MAVPEHLFEDLIFLCADNFLFHQNEIPPHCWQGQQHRSGGSSHSVLCINDALVNEEQGQGDGCTDDGDAKAAQAQALGADKADKVEHSDIGGPNHGQQDAETDGGHHGTGNG